MFVAAQRRFVPGLFLVVCAFIARAAMGGAPATQPTAFDFSPSPNLNSFSPNLNWDQDSHLTGAVGATDDTDTPSVSRSTPIATEAVKAPKSINDPLPPAVWSGLSMLALCAAFISVRKIRQELLR